MYAADAKALAGRRLFGDAQAAPATCSEPFSYGHHQQGAGSFSHKLGGMAWGAKLLDDKDVRDQHAARDPAQQAGSECDHDGEPVYELENQRTTPNDDWHADTQAKNYVKNLMVCVG